MPYLVILGKEVQPKIEDPLGLTLLGLTLSSLTLSALRASSTLSPLPQILVCGTLVMPQPYQFWDMFRSELADEEPYKASISGIRLRLQGL